MIAISPVKPKLTLEDFLSLPETKPYSEYVDGKVEQKPMPQGEHNVIQTFLSIPSTVIICVFKFSPSSPPTLGGTVLCVRLSKSPSIGGFRGQKSQSMTVPSIFTLSERLQENRLSRF